ncbi:hypothetical protein KP509_03G055500 [Ceratopteris richardii]|nr:hypothetical protein KP509_03G055500 [Ceratopteris richardii]
MERAKGREQEIHSGRPTPLSSPVQLKAISENSYNGTRNFWRHVASDGMESAKTNFSFHDEGFSHMAFPDRRKVEVAASNNFESPRKDLSDKEAKTGISTPNKRKIDLEQLPENDSDDEMENPEETFNQSFSNLSKNSRELSMNGFRSSKCTVVQEPVPQISSKLQNWQTNKHLTADHSHLPNSNKGFSPVFSQHEKALPSTSFNAMKSGQLVASSGERVMPPQHSVKIDSSVGSAPKNTMCMPLADHVGRVSQESSRESEWYFQASEANANALARHLVQQQPILSENIGTFKKAFLETNTSTGASMEARKDIPNNLAERLRKSSNWHKDSILQESVVSTMHVSNLEGLISEGGHNMAGMIASAMSVPSINGSNQELNMSLWSSQNPVLQLPQYNQPTVFQQRMLPPTSQDPWQKSSADPQNSMFPGQRVVYGVQSSGPSQINYQGDSVQRNHAEMAASWNSVGHGHYYPSFPLISQKPPFKKPPKLVLKNDGSGMELKRVSPEDVRKVGSNQKKPFYAMDGQSPPSSLKSCGNKLQKYREDVDESKKLEKGFISQLQLPNCTGQTTERSTIGSAIMEPRLLTTESLFSTLPQGTSRSGMLRQLAQQNLETRVSCMDSNDIALGLNLSDSFTESTGQEGFSHLEPTLSSLTPETNAVQVSVLPSLGDAFKKEMLPSVNANVQDQTEEKRLKSGSVYGNCGFSTFDKRRELSHEVVTSQGIADLNSQSEYLPMTTQVLQTKCQKEDIEIDGLDERMQVIEETNGAHLQQSLRAENHKNDASEGKASCSVQITHLSTQPVIAIPVQSLETHTPTATRQENDKLSNISDNDVFHGQPPGIHNSLGSPLSDREFDSAPSTTDTPSVMEVVSDDAIVNMSNMGLQPDSDSENLAASILLSFAPTIEMQNERQWSKDDAGELSKSTCEARIMEKGSNTSRCTETPSTSKSDNDWKAEDGQTLIAQTIGRSQRTDRTQHRHHHHHCRRDRHHHHHCRRDRMKVTINQGHLETNENDLVKIRTVKFSRVVDVPKDEDVPIFRSKQLKTLSGEISNRHRESAKSSHKRKEVIHAPTDRRCSRGAPMGARSSDYYISDRVQHPSVQKMPMLENDSVERGGHGVEGVVKKKALPEARRNRSTSYPRQPAMTHRRSQK